MTQTAHKPLQLPTTSQYTDEQRRAAIGMFVVTGNYKVTADRLNIPQRTINQWGHSEWWLNAIAGIRREKADELDAQVTNSINKAIKSVDERLERGDTYIHPKTGDIAYKPVSCRDSATVLGILYDKRQIMRLLPTTITQTGNDSKLLKLQEKFEQLVSSKTKEIEGSIVSEG